MTTRSVSFRHFPATGGARVRLFCFPYAGAGGATFHGWLRYMPPHVELVAATYPGRESRVREPLERSLDAVVHGLHRDIQACIDLPYIFFGHSMGALVAFELARLLGATRAPEHVYVSGARAPHCPPAAQLHALPPREFLGSLLRLGGFPREILGEPELVAYALPVLRADFAACETHRVDLQKASRFPITAFGGDLDPRVDIDHVHAWRAVAAVGFAARIFTGGHFFLREHLREVVAEVTAPMTAACTGVGA